jgi:uncharacterized protein DUF4339
MTDAWYCAYDGRTAGPFTLRDLETTLAEVPGWKDLRVWREGFSEWRKAGDVEEFASLPGAPAPRPQGAQGRSATAKGPQQNPARRRSIAKTLGGVAIIAVAIIGGAFGGVISRTMYELATGPSTATNGETTKPQGQIELQGQTELQGQAELQGQTKLQERTDAQERATLQERIAKGFAGLGATLPKKVDDVTTMISARSEGTKVIFGYRLDVDGGRLNDIVKARVREVATKDICAERQSRDVLDLGGTFQLVYIDISGRPVTTVDIAKSNCP